MTRPTTRLEQQRHLLAIAKDITNGAYQQQRLADLLDMHLQRRGLCVVSVEERRTIQYAEVRGGPPGETS